MSLLYCFSKKLLQHADIYKAYEKEKNPFLSSLFHSSFMRRCSDVILQVLVFIHPAHLKQIQVPDINKEAQLVLLNALMTMSLKEKSHVTN